MMGKLSNPTAALILLALAGSVALHLLSWQADGTSSATLLASSFESQRKLAHVPATPTRRQERKLKRNGLNNANPPRSFEAILRGRVYDLVASMEEEAPDDNLHGRRLRKKKKKKIKVAKIKAEVEEILQDDNFEPLSVCGRNAEVGSQEDFEALQQYATCPKFTKKKTVLILDGMPAHGRTGNNLVEFLHAIQWARDKDIQLGIMYRSWTTRLLLKMWMAIDDGHGNKAKAAWHKQFERTFCVKIFRNAKEYKKYNVIHHTTKELFHYESKLHVKEYAASQGYEIRQLFRNYNTGGKQHDINNNHAKNMCSGINALFEKGARSTAKYSVIHSRKQEKAGPRLLAHVAKTSGCDRKAALEMTPDYVKGILKPIGMMESPVVLITDGQDSQVLNRLLADEEIGPMMMIVPRKASWIGGDLTLAIMSNVFIGNPASTFSGFIAKSRLALGLGHTYLYRKKDKSTGKWKEVCKKECIFNHRIMGVMA